MLRKLWTFLTGFRPETLFGFGLFVATAGLWFATISLVKESHNTAEQQLRAYVGVSNHDIANFDAADHKAENIDVGQNLQIAVVFENFGQTPAHGVQYWLLSQFTKQPFCGDGSPLSEKLREEKIIVFPGDGFRQYLHIGPLSQDDMAGLKSEARRLYVYGEVVYQDAFDKKRMTKFRLALGGEEALKLKRLAWCEKGNDAD